MAIIPWHSVHICKWPSGRPWTNHTCCETTWRWKQQLHRDSVRPGHTWWSDRPKHCTSNTLFWEISDCFKRRNQLQVKEGTKVNKSDFKPRTIGPTCQLWAYSGVTNNQHIYFFPLKLCFFLCLRRILLSINTRDCECKMWAKFPPSHYQRPSQNVTWNAPSDLGSLSAVSISEHNGGPLDTLVILHRLRDNVKLCLPEID